MIKPQFFRLSFFALVLLNLISPTKSSTTASSECQAFTNSFINAYELNTTGRYAHEYHPFILRKTSASMLQLEEAFAAKGMTMAGRFVLMGYEEHAFPSFLPRMEASLGKTINDESSFKDPRGWSIQLHNRFGTLTGFPFRRINQLKSQSLFEHVCPERVEIFAPTLRNLQKFCFGNLFKSMNSLEQRIYHLASVGDWKKVLLNLIRFWQSLYRGEYKTGDNQVAGTQDILFSIENAKLLYKSPLPLIKFFTGPDITYPIVISQTCSAQATANAQQFITRFVPMLKPINDQKTLYVFRSFVDGVGKSTLLGNIKNWIKHQNNYHNYEIVDNTSTLEHELFPFNDKVWIADLPAQISHFTYKPDGEVWVDLKAISTQNQALIAPQRYFANNFADIKRNYQLLLANGKQWLSSYGPDYSQFHDRAHPERGFIRNLLILHADAQNHYLPFSFEGKHYLGNSQNHKEIKLLCKIGDARSEGLKNADAAQMLFTQGLCLPALYEEFVEKLVSQAQENNIQQVVFVDFLSMYSRSSRENIRLNFLLQTMGKMRTQFNPYNSTYRNFVSNSELLAMLLNRQSATQCLQNLEAETITRYGLYKMLLETTTPNAGCRTVSEQETFKFLSAYQAKMSTPDLQHINQITKKKLISQTKHLKRLYSTTKEFCNLYQLNFAHLCKLSAFLQHLFAENYNNPFIKRLWRGLDQKIVSAVPETDGWFDNQEVIVKLADGSTAQLLCIISPANRDVTTITQLMRVVRTSWYLTSLNILLAYDIQPSEDSWTMTGPQYCQQLPVMVQQHSDGRICLLTTHLPKEAADQNGVVQHYSCLEMDGALKQSYLYDFAFKSTAQTLFAFGADVNVEQFYGYNPQQRLYWYQPGSFLTQTLKKFNDLITANQTINSQLVWEDLESIDKSNRRFVIQELQQFNQSQQAKTPASGHAHRPKTAAKQPDLQKIAAETLKSNITLALEELDNRGDCNPLMLNSGKAYSNKFIQRNLMPDSFVLPAKLFSRIIATLECVLRDLDSAIVTTPKSESFFASLKLIEKCLLPQSFGMIFAKELFQREDDPQTIAPVVELD